MQTWKGLFTENEVKEIIHCIDTQSIKNEKYNNRDNLKIAINEHLGSHPMRNSIINKIESLTQEEVNEIINACTGISKEVTNNHTSIEGLIQSAFDPQEE